MKSNRITRRRVLHAMSMAGAGLPLAGWSAPLLPVPDKGFNFMFLGDIHFDKLKYHDPQYLKEKYPHDISQIENYSRITRDNLSSLMRVSKECSRETDSKFILQIGDFVEGLCGSKELANIQTADLIDYVEQQQFELPFIAIKGNHDITGLGAKEVFQETVLPWQARQLGQTVTSANNVYVYGNARFILFDCFTEQESLVWLREVIKDRKSNEVLFFCTHIPVVPYDARSNWHIYVHPDQKRDREELLNMLGEHKALVLSGHLHKTSVVVRNTPSGNFVQIGLGSVIPYLDAPIKNHLQGLSAYGPDLVDLEPDFAPSSLALRQQILRDEAPFIRHYEYADFCGYATVQIDRRNAVTIQIFANADKKPWTRVNLTKLLSA